MPKLKQLKPEQVVRALNRIGFEKIRQSGSHIVLRNPDGRWTTVPIHGGKDVAKGTLHKIIKDAGVSIEDFMKFI